MEYKNLTKGEIETIFDKMNGYGLDLLKDVIEAWQFNHEEDGSILKNAFDDMYDMKLNAEKDEYKTPLSLTRGLKKSLKSMEDFELAFLEELLELDPYEVFGDNPYVSYDVDEDYNMENIGVNPYDEIRRYVMEERKFRTDSNPVNVMFSKRFKKSMSLKNSNISIRPYSF